MRNSEIARKLEYLGITDVSRYFDNMLEQLLDAAKFGKEMPEFDLGLMFSAHAFMCVNQGIFVAESERELRQDHRFAKTTIYDLIRKWDKWRKKKLVTRRQKNLADKVRREFLRKVQNVFQRVSQEFRDGGVFDLAGAREDLQRAMKSSRARAQMITNTETAYYYNNARREVYDKSPDVKGYLFLAIRDSATTSWCKTRTGLVYHKGDAHLDREHPPVHWNCRSEMLPLVLQNARHRALLEDKTLDRRNHKCTPLPRGWTSSRV